MAPSGLLTFLVHPCVGRASAVRKIMNENVTHEFFGGKRSTQFEDAVTPSDKWHLSSNVKPMTSYLIGVLIDQGSLSHRAGLAEPYELNDSKAWSDALDAQKSTRKQRETLVKAILREAPKFAAGSRYEYSNSGELRHGVRAENPDECSQDAGRVKTKITRSLRAPAA